MDDAKRVASNLHHSLKEEQDDTEHPRVRVRGSGAKQCLQKKRWSDTDNDSV